MANAINSEGSQSIRGALLRKRILTGCTTVVQLDWLDEGITNKSQIQHIAVYVSLWNYSKIS